MIKTNRKFNLLHIITGIGFFLLFTAYSMTNKTDAIDYLSIKVDYSSKTQRITVSDETGIIEKIIVLPADKSKKKKRFERNGYRVIIKEVPYFLDNSSLIRLLEEYNKKGWILNSQSLGVSHDHDRILSGSYLDVCIGQYFLSRKK